MLLSTDLLLAELREQTKWLRFLALRELRTTLEAELVSGSERRAYEATDGERTSREVASAAGVSQATVSRWWSRWQNRGIVETDPRGRSRRLASLTAIGLDLEPTDKEGHGA
jgi:DNA-binding transcriptional ArsR family regulator